MPPRLEVADVVCNNWQAIESGQLNVNTWQLRTLSAIKNCRTSVLGGHIDSCLSCGHMQLSYNSCRNRHCPKCQGHKREEWIVKRSEELLPVAYYHVVFTLPGGINQLAMHQPKGVYNILFQAAWQTIQAFSEDGKWVGGKMGMIAILHTWGQQLNLHPHLHCIVPGGGVSKSGKWKTAKARSGRRASFLFPVKALSKVFRGKYCSMLAKQLPGEYNQIRQKLWQKPWVVYARQPFGGTKQVIEYLGRYTHKVAISNHRLTDISETTVSFSYKDYRHGAKKKRCTLEQTEFIRRFAQHILPKHFVRIRHYGILSSTWKRGKLKDLQHKLGYTPQQQDVKSKLHTCPCCKKPTLVTVFEFDARGPPKYWLEQLNTCNAKTLTK